MSLSFLLAAAVAGAWQVDTLRDPLGQPVYVASVTPDASRPYVQLKYSCGGIVGVELQFNLGEVKYSGVFSTGEPPQEDVHFTFPEGKYDTLARRAPLTEGIGAFEIKGSEAAFVAGLLKDSERVTVARHNVSVTFPLSGARLAIDEVMDACPFKYPELR